MELTPSQIEDLISREGSKRKVAELLGVPESTLRGKLDKDRKVRIATLPDPRVEQLQNENVELKQRLYELQTKTVKPRIIPGKDGKATKVVAIGDTHDQPGQSKDRFKWIARYCMDQKPDRVLQIGDWSDWSSVSAHEPLGSVAHAKRPTFKEDLESTEESFYTFRKETGSWGVPQDITAGNHEDRINRFENTRPETYGSLYSQLDQSAAEYGWRMHPYGQYLFIDSIGFTHCPHTIMGKPILPAVA